MHSSGSRGLHWTQSLRSQSWSHWMILATNYCSRATELNLALQARAATETLLVCQETLKASANHFDIVSTNLSEACQSIIAVSGGHGHGAVGGVLTTGQSLMFLQVLFLRTQLQRGAETLPSSDVSISLPHCPHIDHGHDDGEEDDGGGDSAEDDEEWWRHGVNQDRVMFLTAELIWTRGCDKKFCEKLVSSIKYLLPDISSGSTGDSLSLHTLILLKLRTSGDLRRMEKLIWKIIKLSFRLVHNMKRFYYWLTFVGWLCFASNQLEFVAVFALNQISAILKGNGIYCV